MKIGSSPIGTQHPPYIIAELGVNHDGSVERAIELVDAAAEAGADAIKLQLFEADRLMSKAAKLAAYQKAAGESDPVAMLRRLELSVDQMTPIVARAHDRGIHAIVTVFSVELVNEAERLPWDAYKTASPDIVHKPLLDRLMQTGKPLIVSTGASTMEEVKRAVEWLKLAHDRLAVLQCVSCYPTLLQHAELGGIEAIRQSTGLPTGYSDHTPNMHSGLLARMAGATMLEKHMTYSVQAAGPDHQASLMPHAFSQYVKLAKCDLTELHKSTLGADLRAALVRDGADIAAKRVLDIERDVRTVSRQSLTTTRELPAGHILTHADITFKRPGTGLLPFEFDRAIGRPLARNIEADMPLMETDLGS